MTRILMAEDHIMIRESICHILGMEDGLEVVGQAGTGHETIELARKLHPDIILMDIGMRSLNGLETTKRIKSEFPEMLIIILTQYELTEYIYKAFMYGASGYLLKKSALPELVTAIRAVIQGGFYISPSISRTVVEKFMLRHRENMNADSIELLTEREREVLQLIAEGLPAKMIAERLFISPKTVDVHRTRIMQKLDKHSVVELARYAIIKGIADSSSV